LGEEKRRGKRDQANHQRRLGKEKKKRKRKSRFRKEKLDFLSSREMRYPLPPSIGGTKERERERK